MTVGRLEMQDATAHQTAVGHQQQQKAQQYRRSQHVGEMTEQPTQPLAGQ